MNLIINGKKSKKFKENKLAQTAALVGAYMLYHQTKSTEDGFFEYYRGNKENVNINYMWKSTADKAARDFLKIKSVSCSRNKIKRFYRYNPKRKIKINIDLNEYFNFIMDYCLESSILTNLMINDVVKTCRIFSEKVDEISPYNDCLQQFLGLIYDRIIELSYNTTIVDSKSRKTALELKNKLLDYSRLSDFKEQCRCIHIGNV